MQLQPGEIHVWSVDLTASKEQLAELERLLSPDEIERAYRFVFPKHQHRFIVARSMLREILALYLNCSPVAIAFDYTEHEKPQLAQVSPLQFNLSHSEDIAIYAMSDSYPVGIDIEKTQTDYHQGVAERYFATTEKEVLQKATEDERSRLFYQYWARKEALAKAIGTGLGLSFSSFSVSLEPVSSVVIANHTWTLVALEIHPGYQAALATQQHLQQVRFWKFIDHHPQEMSQLIIDR